MQRIWASNRAIYIGREDHGFVTDAGVFVDRAEAGRIAFEAGQTEKKHEQLLSEHLW